MLSPLKGRFAWRKLMSSEFWSVGLAVLCAASALGVAAQQQSPATPNALPDPNANFPLPDGPGKELVQKDCKDCHTFDRIVHAHYSVARWRVEIKKMEANGADIKAEDIDPLATYLAKHFGPAHAPTKTASQPKPSPAPAPNPGTAAGGGN